MRISTKKKVSIRFVWCLRLVQYVSNTDNAKHTWKKRRIRTMYGWLSVTRLYLFLSFFYAKRNMATPTRKNTTFSAFRIQNWNNHEANETENAIKTRFS